LTFIARFSLAKWLRHHLLGNLEAASLYLVPSQKKKKKRRRIYVINFKKLKKGVKDVEK
jgi:hypothetical protein